MEHVDRRCVCFLGDPGDPWFDGTITRFFIGSGMHEVSFDDGDKKHICLAEHLQEGILRWTDEQPSSTAARVQGSAAVEAVLPTLSSAEPISLTKPPRSKRRIERFAAAESPSSSSGSATKRQAATRAKPSEPCKRKAVAKLVVDDDDDEVLLAEDEEAEAEEAEVEEADGEVADPKPRRRQGKAAADAHPPSSSPRATKGGGKGGGGKGGGGGGGSGRKAAGPRRFAARSVASCGLPVGSLAVGRGGFEVRSLCRVLPLLHEEPLKKALALLGDGACDRAPPGPLTASRLPCHLSSYVGVSSPCRAPHILPSDSKLPASFR